MVDILWLIICYIYIFCVLNMSANLKQFGDETARKFPHIAIANIWFIMNHFFSNIHISLIVPFFMIFIMAYSEKYNIFDGLKREEESISYGTVCYFVSMLILAIIGDLRYGSLIPLGGFFLLLGYGDAFAALFGKRFHIGQYRILNYKKSISGNIAMMVTSLIIFGGYVRIYKLDYSLIQIVFIAFVATIVETLSIKGTDNFTIPVVTYFSYELFLR